MHKKVDTGRRASVADQLARLAGRLTDRDRAILHLIGEHRVFTTGQLAAVFFGSQDRTEHRLRQLTDVQVLARFRPRTRHGEGSASYHYVLGPLGAAVLAAEEETDMNRVVYRQDKALAVAHSQHLAHLVGVNGVFATLIASARPGRPQGATRAALVVWCRSGAAPTTGAAWCARTAMAAGARGTGRSSSSSSTTAAPNPWND